MKYRKLRAVLTKFYRTRAFLATFTTSLKSCGATASSQFFGASYIILFVRTIIKVLQQNIITVLRSKNIVPLVTKIL